MSELVAIVTLHFAGHLSFLKCAFFVPKSYYKVANASNSLFTEILDLFKLQNTLDFIDKLFVYLQQADRNCVKILI